MVMSFSCLVFFVSKLKVFLEEKKKVKKQNLKKKNEKKNKSVTS